MNTPSYACPKCGRIVSENEHVCPDCGIELSLLIYCENEYGEDGWWCCRCKEWFAATFRHTGRNNIVEPRYCPNCGRGALSV